MRAHVNRVEDSLEIDIDLLRYRQVFQEKVIICKIRGLRAGFRVLDIALDAAVADCRGNRACLAGRHTGDASISHQQASRCAIDAIVSGSNAVLAGPVAGGTGTAPQPMPWKTGGAGGGGT